MGGVEAQGSWVRRALVLALFAVAFGYVESAVVVYLRVIVPVPWLGPVLAPVLVALTMIVAGAIVSARTARGRPLQATAWHWGAVIAGAVIIVLSFTRDHGQAMAGETPERFSWFLFGAGLLLALSAFVHAVRRAVVAPRGSA